MNFAIKRQVLHVVFALAVTISLSSVLLAQGQTAIQLPAQCSTIEVPDGNRLAFQVYASGVQVYSWSDTGWVFVGPIANLYADPGFQGKVGTHFGGPTWKSNSGGSVIGKKENECSPDPNSIAWLLLSANENAGAGTFSDVTFIQRVNTSGGKAPSYPGNFEGEEARVPYTTEYYFYRAERPQPLQ